MPNKGTKEKKEKKDPRPNKIPHRKVQNALWGALRGGNLKPRT
jgi:hypothetical protein